MSLDNILLIPGLGGVAVPNWAAMFSGGETGGVWVPSVSAKYTDTGGTVVSQIGDPVARIDDISGTGANAIQATDANRLTNSGVRLGRATGQSLRATFSTSAVRDVIRAIPGVGAQYQRGRLASNRYDINYDNCGIIAISRTLTNDEIAAITRYFDHLSRCNGTYGLYSDLLAPSKPQPMFVDFWTTTSLTGTVGNAPSNPSIPTVAPNNDLDLSYTVSGTAGDKTLTVSAGDEGLFSNTYGGVIQHDDGTWSFYTISDVSGGVMSILPPLKADVTSKVMRNTGSEVSGQHFTEPANRALAWNVFRQTKKSAYRSRWAAKWSPMLDIRNDWTLVSITSAHTLFSEVNAFVGSGTYAGTFLARNRLSIRPTDAIAPYDGSGIEQTFNLNGTTGFMELFISAFPTTAVDVKYTVKLVVDTVTVHDQEYNGPENGYQRIVVDYTNATSATLTVTRTDLINASHEFRIDDVTFWAYDRSQTWADRAIDINGKTVVIGDSWTRWSDDAFSDELQSLITGAGGTGTVVNVGLGGQTAEWGLANFDSLVASESPANVVILFFTNDRNAFGGENAARWLAATYEIMRKCQTIGATPIVLMPAQTQSIAQTSDHGLYAAEIGLGLPI